MIKITVETLWQGKVGIRDKYIDQARKNNEGMEITHKNKQMTILFENLERKILFKSKIKFKDRFSNSSHYLYYMNWVENKKELPKVQEIKQQSLI